MGAADYVILAVIAVSVLIGLWRGMVSEILALVVWLGALWASWQFGVVVAAYLPVALRDPAVRLLCAWVLIFVVVLIFGAVLGWLLRLLVRGTGLGGTDRMLGMLFGATRGLLIVTLAVLLAGMTPLPRAAWWRQSQLIPTFQRAAQALQSRLPPRVAKFVSYASHPLPPHAIQSLPGPLKRVFHPSSNGQ